VNEWSDDDAPSWRRVHGIGRPFQPTAAGRRGCMLLLAGALVLILLALVLIVLT
jgi:hypothetical protein